MSEALFFRLLPHKDKGAALAEAVAAVREARPLKNVIYVLDPASFRQVSGSPFAYWVTSSFLRMLSGMPRFEPQAGRARRGPSSGDDKRRLRAWWEVSPAATGRYARWVPYAKGGNLSPYYSDIPIVICWDEKRRTFLDFTGRPGREIERPECLEEFFLPGLTWPRRASRFSPSIMPSGCIFSVRGQAILSEKARLPLLLGMTNSWIFDYIFKLFLGRFEFPEFIAGILQKLPWMEPDETQSATLSQQALRAFCLKREIDTANEVSHAYVLSPLLKVTGDTLAMRLATWNERNAEVDRLVAECQRQADEIALSAYGLVEEERCSAEELLQGLKSVDDETAKNNPDDIQEVEECKEAEGPIANLISYCVGIAFGRWDVRYATGDRIAPELLDPFGPLPACSPGMLSGPDGLPAREAPPGYPLRINWDGVLVDDPGSDGNNPHENDIIRRVREVLYLIWSDRAEAVEREACEILGVNGLRDWFRNPRGFFDHHIKQYSKSQRRAPIYWFLQSNRRSFGLWLYYHRLDKDTLFKAIQYYIEPKVRGEQTRLRELAAQLEAGKNALPPRERTRLEKAIDAQHEILNELMSFKEALQRVVALGFDPDLNDGVVLNIAPLHERVPWRDAKKYWDELTAGKYEWSMISQRLRAKGLVRG